MAATFKEVFIQFDRTLVGLRLLENSLKKNLLSKVYLDLMRNLRGTPKINLKILLGPGNIVLNNFEMTKHDVI